MDGPTRKRLKHLAGAVIAGGVAWVMGEAYAFKPPPGFDPDAFRERLDEAANLRFPGS